jgi:hypothetical protein
MDAQGIFRKYCQRNTVSLFKGFLVMLEDLQREHQIHFDEEKLQHLRKRTLDLGNETIRNVESELENFTISFTFNN